MAQRLKTQVLTEVGYSDPVVIEDTVNPRVAYMVKVVSGDPVYSIEHSLDGLNFIENTDAQDQNGDVDGNYILPINTVRVNFKSGTGEIRFIVRQLVI